ncbi:Nramp family divalent metal transporter [candidate division KSB1 bacterium]|nr:Nramp family divalent metal transporter [candidate division KSB1 bacterium]
MSAKTSNKLLIALSAIGPGLFLIGYNIGTGSVTTMARSGAKYGMALFWALLLSCIFTYVLMVAYGKVTLVTGRTALFNIKTRWKYGNILALYIMIALILGELLALMGVTGIVADLLQEGVRLQWGYTGLSRFWIIVILVVTMYALLWHGRYHHFERVLTFFVILMGLCFIVVFFMVRPSFTALLTGLVPRVPDEPGAFALVAAMAGTTCSAAVFIIRSIVVAEKGWTAADLDTEKKDAFVSATSMLFLSGIIMAVSAGTLHVMGMELENTVEMIHLFQPIGGKIAAFILIFGIAAAGLSTIFPIILIAPWLVSDYTGRPRDIRSPLYRILGFIGLLFCFGLEILQRQPPAMMIFSQAFQACILPAVAIPIFILINDKELLKNHKATAKLNCGLAAVVLFSLLTTYFALIDLF